ncbi:MAG TPA: hypothetical protein VLJ58_00340 [Ramlibacter sp.]|nr:hypothetical protein [Ramlibacter sp.]
MTELEQRLAAEGGETLRDELLARLVALEGSLRMKLAASVPRADFKPLAASADAARAAQEILQAWPVGAAARPAGPVEKQQPAKPGA